MQQSPMTLTGAACAAILCLYAVGTSGGADTILHGPEKNYEAAIARAELMYRVAQDVCDKEEGSKRELCLKEAKATHVRAVSDAKARLKAAQMVSDEHWDPARAQIESKS
jgi:hypothetical protein